MEILHIFVLGLHFTAARMSPFPNRYCSCSVFACGKETSLHENSGYSVK